MKIGIYTVHIVHNYGAQLQAYATYRFLQHICLDSEIEFVNVVTSRPKFNIRCFIKNLFPSFWVRLIKFKKFHNLIPQSRRITPKQLFHNPIDYDLHITGSDQIWNVSAGMRDYPVYFLPFINEKPKISLASSFGVSDIPENIKIDVKKYLSSFDSLSVRESDGVKILKELELDAKQILDPTFWVNRDEWDKLAGDVPIIKGHYIVAYGFEVGSNIPQIFINKVKETYNLPVIGFDAARSFSYDRTYNIGGPKEFLNIFKYATVVITGSFHGTAFSIIFRKDFYVLPHSIRNSRMESLLNLFNLSNRMVSVENLSELCVESIDYKKNEDTIYELQNDTRQYIKQIIKKYTLYQ